MTVRSALYDYDDFEECRRTYRDKYLYCIVRAHFSPDDESLLWKNLSSYSEHPFRYDRRIQERGICVPDCERFSQGVQLSDASGYDEDDTYVDLFRSCINLKLEKHYNIRAGTNIEIVHCYSEATAHPSYDYMEILFCIIFGQLLVFVCFSTWADLRIQKDQRFPKSYFSRSHTTRRERLLTSFSVPRNIRHLKSPVNSAIRKELQFLESFRFVQIYRVILLHVIVGVIKAPTVNPESIEQMLSNPAAITYVADFQNYVQTFLSISGMLLAVNFLEHTRKNPNFSINYFWDRLVARIIRLVPAYLFIMLLEVSINRRFQGGPVGQHFIGATRDKCRQIWWINLLFINNFLHTDQPCLIQMWYLATDLQLYAFSIGALMLIWRWPVLKKYVFAAISIWGLGFVTLIVYVRSIPPVMTEDLKLSPWYNFGHRYFLLYQPFYTNITVYFAGILAGFLYHRYRESRQEVLNSRFFKLVFYTLLMMQFFAIFSVSWVVRNQDTLHPILSAIYATGFKYNWGVLSTVIQLQTALLPQQSRFRSFFSHPIFVVLGKLCYSFYLIHFSIILQVVGSVKQPIYYSVRGVVSIQLT
ncbi:nose resistant to fluoxetine protein 6-like [Malaya genurostris]|uniref:nose resistant to fluoxetine protein 6-like n=1 Tax=Malaya genurostris TaxID=325434 RepID=UPI0026F3851B|nr:nose resistant to fluoxetine protein 6-like [Malaya genurostris]